MYYFNIFEKNQANSRDMTRILKSLFIYALNIYIDYRNEIQTRPVYIYNTHPCMKFKLNVCNGC